MTSFGVRNGAGRTEQPLVVINEENYPKVPADARLCLRMLAAQFMVVKG